MARIVSWIELASGNGFLKGATAACVFNRIAQRQFFACLKGQQARHIL